MPRTAMLDRILEGFLHDAEETKRNLLRESFWDVFAMKINLHSLPFRYLFAESGGRHFKAEII